MSLTLNSEFERESAAGRAGAEDERSPQIVTGDILETKNSSETSNGQEIGETLPLDETYEDEEEGSINVSHHNPQESSPYAREIYGGTARVPADINFNKIYTEDEDDMIADARSFEMKFAMLGDMYVGKTSLLWRFKNWGQSEYASSIYSTSNNATTLRTANVTGSRSRLSQDSQSSYDNDSEYSYDSSATHDLSSIATATTSNTHHTQRLPIFNPTVRAAIEVHHLDNVGGSRIRLLIWDTAGQERFNSLVKMYYRDVVCGCLVFDCTQPRSLERTKIWLNPFRFDAVPEAVVVLVANKIDSPDRQITREQGERYAFENGLFYAETSALTGEGVMELFINAVKQVMFKIKRKKITYQDAVSTTTKKDSKRRPIRLSTSTDSEIGCCG